MNALNARPGQDSAPSGVYVSASRQRRYSLSATAVGTAAAAFGLWRLGQKGLWPDEAFSASAAHLDLPALFQVATSNEVFSALYYVILHFWQILGTTETWLRLPSVAFGVAAVVTLFALNERLFGLFTAIVACALLTVNAFFIRYMQEARSYTLAVFLVVAASYCFVLALERSSARRWLAYAVAGASAIYAHLFSGFVIVAHLLSLAARRDRPHFRFVSGAYLLMAVLVAPLGTLFLMTDFLERSFIPVPGRDSFEWLFLHLTGGGAVRSRNSRLLLLTYFVLCCAGIIAMARAVVGRSERRTRAVWPYGFMFLWLAAPVVLTFLVSFARPIFYPRYLIVVLPALVTIAAYGASTLPHWGLRVLAPAALLSLSTPALVSYYRTEIREGGDWRGAAEYVLREKAAGDRILFLSRFGRGPFEYYLVRSNQSDALVPLYPGHSWGAYTEDFADRYPEDSAIAAKHLRDVARVWIVLNWGGFQTTADNSAPIIAALDEGLRQLQARQFGPSLEVRLYVR